jgi:hypothetical protein
VSAGITRLASGIRNAERQSMYVSITGITLSVMRLDDTTLLPALTPRGVPNPTPVFITLGSVSSLIHRRVGGVISAERTPSQRENRG